MNRSFFLILLVVNSVSLLAYGGLLVAYPPYIFDKLSAYALFNWEEFAFAEGAVAYYLVQIVRCLGGCILVFGVTGALFLTFNWKQAQKGFWYMLFFTNILPLALLMGFAFFTTRFGVVEMLGTLILGLSLMAWWRLKGGANP